MSIKKNDGKEMSDEEIKKEIEEMLADDMSRAKILAQKSLKYFKAKGDPERICQVEKILRSIEAIERLAMA